MTEDRNSVQSIERAFDIMEAVAVEQNGLGITEIAERTGLHKSTAFRIVSTMIERGYLMKTEAGKYKIGLKCIEVASCFITGLELQTEARPYVSEMASHLGLTSYLGILDGDKVLYVERIDTVSPARLFVNIGQKVNAYCSSLGKCLLSIFSREQVNEIMKDCSFIKFTPKTISGLDALHRELAKVRRNGWAMDDGEFEKNHRCIGAPVYDYRGDIIAAVSASGDKHVIPDDRIEEISEYVMKTASEISKAMGYIE